MPRPGNLEKIAEAFEIDVSEFYATDHDNPNESQLDRIENLLNELLDRLVADGVLRAVAEDERTEQPTAPSKRRRPAT